MSRGRSTSQAGGPTDKIRNGPSKKFRATVPADAKAILILLRIDDNEAASALPNSRETTPTIIHARWRVAHILNASSRLCAIRALLALRRARSRSNRPEHNSPTSVSRYDGLDLETVSCLTEAVQRNEALTQIREQFNPFDLKHAKAPKFDVTTNRPKTGFAAKGITGRPTAANTAGEERRRETILAEYQNRSKVGGIIDRRFGEYDQNMSEETRAMERFAAEKQRRHKKTNLFDLEEPEGLSEPLTHGGQALTFEGDDFDEDDLDGLDDDSDGAEARRRALKRIRAAEEDEAAESEPERKKSKKEVMEEIIAKSKQGKYERQVAKDEDEEMRMELDKELGDLRKLLAGHSRKEAAEDDKPAKLVAGVDQASFNKDFDRYVLPAHSANCHSADM